VPVLRLGIKELVEPAREVRVAGDPAANGLAI
jgi:hypothetical protein